MNEDNEIFLEVIKGDKSAFNKLYYRHKDFIFKKIKYKGYHRLVNIDDLTQGVWIKLWKTKTYYAELSFKTFLVMICKSVCLDEIEKTKTKNPINNDPIPIENLNEEALCAEVERPLTSDEILMLEQRKEMVLALLPKLNDVEREVYLLTSVGEMTLEECAQAMGITRHMAKYRLVKAINELNHLLRNQL